MSTDIIIPTYNRSAKLQRTLLCYKNLIDKHNDIKIYVLDGSQTEHHQKNQQTCEQFSQVKYIYAPKQSLHERLINHLESYPEKSTPVCLATDEDVFLPDYIQKSKAFLNKNPEYSMLVGRYITFLRPLGPFHRRSSDRDVILDVNINQNESERRISTLSQILIMGCSPVYWGTRRVENLLTVLKIQKELKFLTSKEIIDQVILAHQGKIFFKNTPMLLRDETNIGYVTTEDRQDQFNYFPEEERESFLQTLENHGGTHLREAAHYFADRYITKYTSQNQPSLTVQQHQKTYSKYSPILKKENIVSKTIYSIRRITAIFCEIICAQNDIKALKSIYPHKAIKIFLTKVKSNQLAKEL